MSPAPLSPSSSALASAPAPAPARAHEHAPANTVQPPSNLEVVHQTTYHYETPVRLAHHLAHLRPLQDPHQQRLSFDVDVQPAPSHSHRFSRSNSNQPEADHQAWFFSLAQTHRSLHVKTLSRVRVWPRFAALAADASPAWDVLAASLRFQAGRATPPAVAYTFASHYVPRLAALRHYAAPSFPTGRPVAQAALDLMQRVHTDFQYQSDSTKVDTPIADVLKHRRGVCQDFAHLMCGALRMLGLPARYVSGYLLTQPPQGGPALLGADATHAWLQLWCPGTPGVPTGGSSAGWLDLDPTNNRLPDTGYVRLATGRDFGDVTPLRGVITGGGQHSLHVAVSTRLLPCGGAA